MRGTRRAANEKAPCCISLARWSTAVDSGRGDSGRFRADAAVSVVREVQLGAGRALRATAKRGTLGVSRDAADKRSCRTVELQIGHPCKMQGERMVSTGRPRRRAAAFVSPHGIALGRSRDTQVRACEFTRPRVYGARARAAPHAVCMSLAFRKYHGLGNDFILVDNREQPTPVLGPEDAERICDRHRGVGGDGVIFLLPPKSESADAQMRLYNSDGSEPEMCGNGIRCLARFAADLGLETTTPGKIVFDTGAGVIVPELVNGSESVRVDMGPAYLEPSEIPTTLECTSETGYVAKLENVAGRDWEVTTVSMGNPHCITFVEKDVYDAMDEALEQHGPDFESHPVFPARTNTEFVVVKSETEMDMLVWERGAGRTQACGTGACAVGVAAVLTGRAKKDTEITVHLPGGDLIIEWSSETGHVFMTGPAELVYSGSLEM